MTRPLSFRVIEGGRHDRLPAFVPEPVRVPVLTPAEAWAWCVVGGVLFVAGCGTLAWVWWGGK